jgi:hypothetical protein
VVGSGDGGLDGNNVGFGVGSGVGTGVGEVDGVHDGPAVGGKLGDTVGAKDGVQVGWGEGRVGASEGCRVTVGNKVGAGTRANVSNAASRKSWLVKRLGCGWALEKRK